MTLHESFSEKSPVFKLNMPGTQTCLMDGNKMKTADMYGCFLWAKSTQVANDGKPVYLTYEPLSTAIRFKLKAKATTIIERIELATKDANVALSGEFTVNLAGDKPVISIPDFSVVSTSLQSK